MTKQELFDKYPVLLGDVFLDVGPGWLPMIDELCSKLKETGLDVKAQQVKEKFGGLRFYTNNESEPLDKLVTYYENKSYHICDTCGSEEHIGYTSGWMRTLCKSCVPLEDAKRVERGLKPLSWTEKSNITVTEVSSCQDCPYLQLVQDEMSVYKCTKPHAGYVWAEHEVPEKPPIMCPIRRYVQIIKIK